MVFSTLEGVPLPLFRLVLGVADATAPGSGPPLWDAFVAAGGNAFDTAYWYGAKRERRLGRWLEARGIRDEVVVVGKAAHTPECAPGHVARHVAESLDRLGTDRLDVLLLHRDEPDVPADEWAAALGAEVTAGRARAVGVSNWTTARFEALDRAAVKAGSARPVLLSNQLSLVRMVGPVWEGTVGVDAATERWLERTQTPLLAWSSTARGFLDGRRGREVERSWRSPVNLARRRRARALARRLRIPVTAVALAWILARPYPTFAVAGPRTRDELTACLDAFRVSQSAVEGMETSN